MKLDEYQKLAAQTTDFQSDDPLSYLILGMCGEAGEVADKRKKQLRKDPHPTYKQELAKELGDVLWYLSALASELGFTLEQIAHLNLDKLADRKRRGVIKGTGDSR